MAELRLSVRLRFSRFPFFANRAKVRSIYEDFRGLFPLLLSLARMWTSGLPMRELIPKYTQLTDIYGVVRDNAQIILAMSAVEMETQLADLIGLGASTVVDYDNKNFFAVDHECNPNQPGLQTFSNYKTSFDLNYANVNTALDLLDAVPGPDGNPAVYAG